VWAEEHNSIQLVFQNSQNHDTSFIFLSIDIPDFGLNSIVNLKKEKLLERITKLEKEMQEMQDVIKVLYYLSYPHKFDKIDCKGIFLKKK